MSILMNAQDVTATYNLSEISSYLKVGRISENTYHDMKCAIDSLHEKYYSADYVIDFLEAKDDSSANSVALADSLIRLNYRMAFIIGHDTENSAEQVARLVRKAGKAITSGDTTRGGLVPDIKLTTNEEWKTAWFDSIASCHFFEKTAQEYARTFDVKANYHNAKDLLKNFSDNGELITLLNEVAGREGIKQNDAAFYYSGFNAVARARAELIRVVYPDDVDIYNEALNVPVQQAIIQAMDIMESRQYRKLVAGETQEK